MANRVFQSVIYQMKDAINRVVGVVDETGAVISCSELNLIGEVREGFMAERLTAGDRFVRDGYTYQQFSSAKHNDYAVFVEGVDETAGQFAAMLSISLQSIKQYHDEKFDKSNFIKNVVLDNILPGDIHAKPRAALSATGMFPAWCSSCVLPAAAIFRLRCGQQPVPRTSRRIFVFNISETDTVLVKEIRKASTAPIWKSWLPASWIPCPASITSRLWWASAIYLQREGSGYLFKEAQIAMEVSKVFDTEKQIIRYDNLGIARLIYQLPTTVCEMFLREVFKQGSIESLDQETLFTIQRFFENNLNVSETSRGLFVHRNTLVYRLKRSKS